MTERQAEGTGAIVSVVQTVNDRGNVVTETKSRQFHVRETNPHTDRRWESFVMQHPAATIYHHPAWLAALEREYKQQSVYLICEDEGGELHGVFPLMYTRGLPLGKGRPLAGVRLASLPRTPLAGPLTSDPHATMLLLQEAVRRVSATANIRLQIKPPQRELGGLVDGVVEKPWRFTYLLRLQETPGEPLRFSNSKHRTTMKGSISRALANGLRPRLAETEDDLKRWYSAYLDSMRRNVVPARPYRFFHALWQSMGPKGLMRVWLVEHHTDAGATIVGGHIYFKLGKTLSYAFNGAQTSALPLRPMTSFSGRPSTMRKTRDAGLSILAKCRTAMRAWRNTRSSGALNRCASIAITIPISRTPSTPLREKKTTWWQWQRRCGVTCLSA